MIQVVNKYKHTPTRDDIYIGRGSPFGNPYSHLDVSKAEFKVATREEAVEKYEPWLRQKMKDDVTFYHKMMHLKTCSKVSDTTYLVCFCKPQSCHGDVIVKVVNELS